MKDLNVGVNQVVGVVGSWWTVFISLIQAIIWIIQFINWLRSRRSPATPPPSPPRANPRHAQDQAVGVTAAEAKGWQEGYREGYGKGWEKGMEEAEAEEAEEAAKARIGALEATVEELRPAAEVLTKDVNVVQSKVKPEEEPTETAEG
ncbi:MAG: hypothetical protein M1816_000483 [Peltula sp. TS41687]|nr:MAG: hypothetical protein M1816_000483 [Peltula sp. TS41687]